MKKFIINIIVLFGVGLGIPLTIGLGIYLYLTPNNIHVDPKPEPVIVDIAPKWLEYPSVRNVTNYDSSLLNDLESHLPKGHPYDESDRVTCAHECSHGINSYVRQKYSSQGKINAFYCFEDKAIVFSEPNTTLSEIAKVVPQSLRGLMYKNYVINMQSKKLGLSPDPKNGVCKTLCSKILRGGWNNEPLYLMDEWVSYTNGTEVGLNLVANGKWKDGQRWDTVQFMMEFNNIALCLAYKVKSNDNNFKAFMQWQLERTIKLMHEAEKYPNFNSENISKPWQTLRTANDCDDLRKFTREYFGNEWTLSILKF
jgi:hypothetical protein